MANILSPGTRAPDFTLQSAPDKKISLSEYRGQPVIIAFYPSDWSPVCSDEMSLFNEVLPEFRKYQAELLGISVDNSWCHSAFSANRNLQFPLLADFEPKGAVAKKYGVYQDHSGVSERALFLIDKNGTIAWSYLSPMKKNPGADGILAALEQLSKKENH